jgi:hypothetical protein
LASLWHRISLTLASAFLCLRNCMLQSLLYTGCSNLSAFSVTLPHLATSHLLCTCTPLPGKLLVQSLGMGHTKCYLICDPPLNPLWRVYHFLALNFQYIFYVSQEDTVLLCIICVFFNYTVDSQRTRPWLFCLHNHL